MAGESIGKAMKRSHEAVFREEGIKPTGSLIRDLVNR